MRLEENPTQTRCATLFPLRRSYCHESWDLWLDGGCEWESFDFLEIWSGRDVWLDTRGFELVLLWICLEVMTHGIE